MKDAYMNRLTIVFIILALTTGLWAQEIATYEDPNDLQLEMNFRDVPLETVVTYLSEKTGLIIQSGNGLNQRTTIISRDPVNLDEAISLLNDTLADAGYTAIRQGRKLRIVPQEEAILDVLPIHKGGDANAVTPSANMEYRIVPIRYRNVEQLMENLQPLMPSYATLQANTEGNVLLITDTAANIKRLLEIINNLDVPMSATAEIEVFQLRNADASSVAEIINQLFDESSSSSSDNKNSRNPFSMMMNRGGRGGGPGGMGGGGQGGGDSGGSSSESSRGYVSVTAAADTQTNSVVVSGPSERIEVIRTMIEGLDKTAAELASVKVFHLEYADADNTADLINDVFGLTGSSSRSSNQQNNRMFGRGGGPGGMMGGNDTTSTSSNADVIAAADSQTNSVVVSGPPETLVIIEGIIKDLDSNPDQERQIFAYALKNADSSNLMEILNDMFTQMQEMSTESSNQGGMGGGGGPGGMGGGGGTTTSSSGNSGLDDETYFQAETETNTLLVMTSTRNYEKIVPIIKQLDKPLGQVLIKVLLAEVTLSDDSDMGVEFTMNNIWNNNQGTVSTETSWLNMPEEGLVLNSITGDLDLTIQALQEKYKMNVLSRPYILASNNQAAKITVGEEIPRVTGSTLSSDQTTTSVDYNDVGIILEVTPSINPDGLVNMTVSPEISSMGEDYDFGTTLTSPTFTTRSAETQVSVRDGQTIVIGGLMQDRYTDVVTKVPLLGDIPILGKLFRRDEKTKEKTELLIFLTPCVAKDPLALTPISNAKRDQSSFNTDPTAAEIFKKHMEELEQHYDVNDLN